MTVEYDSCSLTIEAFVQTRDPRAWDVYAADDPNGPILATLDDLEVGRGFRVELDGTGSGHFKINRSSPNATAAVMTKGNIVKCRIPEISTDYIFAFVLEQGDFELLDSDEEGAEILEFGGRGILAYLDRAIMWKTAFSTGLDTADVWTKIWQTSVVKDPVGAAVVGGDPTYLYVISATTRRIYKVRQSDRKIVRTSPVLWSGSTNYAGGLSADPADATILWALEAPWSQGGSGNTKIRKIRISDWAVTATHDLGSAVKLTEIKADSTNLWASRFETTNTIQKRSKVDGSVVTNYSPITYNGVAQQYATGISVNGTKLAYWYLDKQRALISDTSHPTTIDDVIKTTGISAFGGDWTTEGGNDFFYPVSYTADVTWKYQVTVATPHDPLDGIWRLDEATPGAILWRLMQEWQHASRPQHPLPDATYAFTSTDDSTAVDWATHDGTTEFDAPVGEKGVSVVLRLIPYGLKVQMSPYLELGGYNAFGVDRSAGAFASGKVRFVGGVNIADRLQRRLDAREIDSDVLAKGDGNLFATAADHSLGYTVEGFVDTQLKDATALAGTADAELDRQRSISESLAFEASWITEGGTAGADGYRPGPAGSDGHYWVGDTIRLLTGSGELDYNEIDFGIYAITLEEQENGAWKSFVELGSELLPGERFGSGSSGSGGVRQVGGGGGGGGTVVASSSGVTVKDSISGDSATGTTIESDDWGVSSPGTGRINVAIRARALAELSDTILAEVTDGQGIAWDATLEAWVPVDLSSGSSTCFDIRDYGALVDGTTDDRVAVQAANDAAHAAGGGAVCGPPGVVAIGSPGVAVDNDVIVSGAGQNATVWRSLADGINIFTFLGTALDSTYEVNHAPPIFDCEVDGNGHTDVGIGWVGVAYFTPQRVTFRDLSIGGDLYGSLQASFDWCKFLSCAIGLKPEAQAIGYYGGTLPPARIRTNFCTFYYNAGKAVEITGGAQWVSNQDEFGDNGTAGDATTAAVKFTGGGDPNGVGLVMIDPWIEANHGFAAVWIAASATPMRHYLIRPWFAYTDATYSVVVDGSSAKQLLVIDGGGHDATVLPSTVKTVHGIGPNAELRTRDFDFTRSGTWLAVRQSGLGDGTLIEDLSEWLALRLPNLTTTQRNAIATPTAGMLIWNTTTASVQRYSGSAWADVGGTVPGFATPAIVLGTAAAAGAASTVIRSDATIVAFDATAPTDIPGPGVASATGSAAVAARRDHKHALTYHDEPLTDGASNFIFAGGDIVVVTGVPN